MWSRPVARIFKKRVWSVRCVLQKGVLIVPNPAVSTFAYKNTTKSSAEMRHVNEMGGDQGIACTWESRGWQRSLLASWQSVCWFVFVQPTTPLMLGVYDSHPLLASQMIDHRRASLSKQHYMLPFHGTQQGLINSFNHSFYHDVTHVRKDTRLSPAFLYCKWWKAMLGPGNKARIIICTQ